MKKQTRPYEVTTAEDGTIRALMVHEVYGNVLPNALQNALIEAAQAVSNLAYDLKIDDPDFDDLYEHLVEGCPVLSKDYSSELASKGKRPARPPFARTPRPASCAFSSRGFIWKRCTRGASPGLGTSRPGGTAG